MIPNMNPNMQQPPVGGVNQMSSGMTPAMSPQGSAGIPPEIMQRLQALPPEQRQAFMQKISQDYQGQEAQATQQSARAKALRDTPTPKGRSIGSPIGELYVAANPLEHLGSAMQRGVGAYEGRQATDRMKGLSNDKSEALRRMMELQGGV